MHVAPLLQGLRWLLVPQRVEYKLAMLVYRCLHGLAPSYLADELQLVADLDSSHRLHSSLSDALVVPPSLHRRRPSISGFSSSYLERTASTRHIVAIVTRLQRAFEDSRAILAGVSPPPHHNKLNYCHRCTCVTRR